MKLVISFLFFLVSIGLSAQQLQYQSHEMEYDDLNRLSKVFFSNGIVHEYVYDNLGNRLERLVYEAPKTYVPDDAFEQHLIDEGYDTVMDDYVYTHKIDDVEELFIENLGIADLTGIEDFIALKSLIASSNQITSIDVTQNINLEILFINNNNIEAIDVTQNSQLKYLELNDNDITELDITQNTLLEILAIQSTPISILDFSNAHNFKELYAANSSLTDLDFSSNPFLQLLYVGNNNLESLNVRNNNNNILTDLITAGNENLYCIKVDYYDAANIGIGVYANWQTDAQVQYSYDCNLTYVPDDAFEQRLIDLGYDVVLNDYVVTAEIDDIEELFLNNLGISDLTGIEDFEALENLSCSGNNLDSLDVTANLSLKQLWCSHNNLTSLDITMLTDLFIIDCGYNNITSLDLSNNLLLRHIGIASTLIETVDLSNHSEVTWFEALNGQLTNLNLKNGNNSTITYMYAGNNPNLFCIQVDDEIAANNGTGVYSTWVKDSIAEYGEDCQPFGLPADNYTINTVGLTCINSGDGIIQVQAEKPRNYTVQIVSEENNVDDFFPMNPNNGLEVFVDYLEGGEYFIHITLDGIPEDVYKKTFILHLHEPVLLEVGETFTGNPSGRYSLNVNAGTAPFTVRVNNEVILTTNNNQINFDVQHGDIIELTTAKSCEGKFTKTIDILEYIVMHPNPTDGLVIFDIPIIDTNNIEVQLFDINGRLIQSFNPTINSQRVGLSIHHLSNGVYLAKFPILGEATFKIIKE